MTTDRKAGHTAKVTEMERKALEHIALHGTARPEWIGVACKPFKAAVEAGLAAKIGRQTASRLMRKGLVYGDVFEVDAKPTCYRLSEAGADLVRAQPKP